MESLITSVAGNDLQSTLSDQFVSVPGICQVDGEVIRTSKRYHYRLVLGTVGSPLKTVRGAKELLHATYDVLTGMLQSHMCTSLVTEPLTAMRDALAKDSRLHRDISVANIILVQEADRDVRRGYLIDWDASCRVDDAGDALEEGRAVSPLDPPEGLSSHKLIPGHLAIHVDPHARCHAGVLQTDIPGRYGVVTLRGPLLRVVVATPQLL